MIDLILCIARRLTRIIITAAATLSAIKILWKNFAAWRRRKNDLK